VPIDHVIAIYARENGQGMAFPMPTDAAGSDADRQQARQRRRPSRGPRLAGPAGAASRKGGTALTLSPSPGPASRPQAEPPSDAPPPSDPPSPKRPSLKRVK
jgi:stringent starvation protein B